jgi:integrase
LVIERLLPDPLRKAVTAITPGDIVAFCRTRQADAIKASTINRDLRTLSAMLRKARPDFQFPRGAFAQEEEERVRWLPPQEEAALFAALPGRIGDIARLAAITLMRLSEILKLRRQDVDLSNRLVRLSRAKTGPRPVILSDEATAIIARNLGQHDRDWVFPNPNGRPYSRAHVSRVFRFATRRLNLVDFHFHDLRHHGATKALNAGYSAPIVMALGGWKTERMMRRYAAVTDPTLRSAAEAVSATDANGAGIPNRQLKDEASVRSGHNQLNGAGGAGLYAVKDGHDEETDSKRNETGASPRRARRVT